MIAHDCDIINFNKFERLWFGSYGDCEDRRKRHPPFRDLDGTEVSSIESSPPDTSANFKYPKLEKK